MSKKIWITTGVVAAAAVGLTVFVAHAERGRHGHGYGDGYHDGERGGYHGMRGHRRWGGSWRREMTKADFDAETRAKFAEWDANGDGVVDATEAEARIASRMQRRRGRRGGRRWERMLRRFDADRDGKVTAAEAEAYVTERFQRMDLTGDGRITDEDLPPMMRGLNILSGDSNMHRGHRFGHGGHHRGDRRGMRMMRHIIGADTNKDGAITLQELQDRAKQRFARFDRNKDGAIDQADRDALRKEMVDYRVLRFMHRFGAKDGKLTAAQFAKFRDERFAKRDADGDGTIERNEMRGGGRGWGRHHHWERDRDDDGGREERGGRGDGPRDGRDPQ